MGKVLAFKKKEEPEQPTMQGPAHCLQCSHEWQAIAPVGTIDLECPSCRSNKGIFSTLCFPQEDIWVCYCGNRFFLLTRSGHWCPNCGVYNQYG